MRQFMKRFLHEEGGAVTVDWVVLTAAIALLSVPLLISIDTATETATAGIAERIDTAGD